ncbi:MAG: hypothetical protein ABIR29_11875 [Chthoniobacterales bacterium]
MRIDGGTLNVANLGGSATGVGTVQVSAGTLGGTGIIAGPTIVGTGNGGSAFLAPALGIEQPLTLTLQSTLTFKADSTYTYAFRAKGNKAQTDKVIANGVTIESGASFNFTEQLRGHISQGLVFTVISNTSAAPIVGVFDDLPDGGILTVTGNNPSRLRRRRWKRSDADGGAVVS